MSKKSSAKRKKFFRDFKYLILNPFTWGYAIIFVILVIATSVVYKSETLTESGIETKFDSVWFTLVSVLAGYFDYCVQSVPGRIAALFLLILGMLLLSAVTGKIASLFMDIQMKQDKGLVRLKKMKGHFLLCGWRACINHFRSVKKIFQAGNGLKGGLGCTYNVQFKSQALHCGRTHGFKIRQAP